MTNTKLTQLIEEYEQLAGQLADVLIPLTALKKQLFPYEIQLADIQQQIDSKRGQIQQVILGQVNLIYQRAYPSCSGSV